MKIRTKGIQHERLMEAPFIGALIASIQCSHNCPGCFNQVLKQYPTQEMDVDVLLDEVEYDTFNEGIILGGLEWTEQPEELRVLVKKALNRHMYVMLYTHLTEEQFRKAFPDLCELPIWVKFGEYREDLRSDTYMCDGIRLASTNQYIKRLGK